MPGNTTARRRPYPPCRGAGTTGSAPGPTPRGLGPGADLVPAAFPLPPCRV